MNEDQLLRQSRSKAWYSPCATTTGSLSAHIACTTAFCDSFKVASCGYHPRVSSRLPRPNPGCDPGNHSARTNGDRVNDGIAPCRSRRMNSSRALSACVGSSRPMTLMRSTPPQKLPPWTLTLVLLPCARTASPVIRRPCVVSRTIDVCIGVLRDAVEYEIEYLNVPACSAGLVCCSAR